MPTVKLPHKPIILAILDGWGLSPSWGGNAISMNNPVTINFLWRSFPLKVLQAFSPLVNPGGKVGNSEIGHSCIGGGRLVRQDSARISEAIIDKTFFDNEVLKKAIISAKNTNNKLHLIGLLSDGWVHSHLSHLKALVNMAKAEGISQVYIHAITDGVDTPPLSALQFMADITTFLKQINFGKIATVCGRYYAMDRDNHWDRTAAAYQLYSKGIGARAETPSRAISAAYSARLNDEKILPTMVFENGQPITKIADGDSVIFFNFRADRMKQIVASFIDPNSFKKIMGRQFPVLKILPVTLTSYRINLPVEIAFPYIYQKNNLTEVLSENGFRQLHMAESEKQAHVSYFFDGGNEKPVPGERYEIVPSPNTDAYNKTPQMSARELTKRLLGNLTSAEFILINFANVDMVGHTGDILAAADAVKFVDECIKEIYEKAVEKRDAILIVTADHGNAEQMTKLSSDIEVEATHTLNPVPFILVSPETKRQNDAMLTQSNLLNQIVSSNNTLADIAPTILELCNIPKPAEMTGKSLIGVLE